MPSSVNIQGNMKKTMKNIFTLTLYKRMQNLKHVTCSVFQTSLVIAKDSEISPVRNSQAFFRLGILYGSGKGRAWVGLQSSHEKHSCYKKLVHLKGSLHLLCLRHFSTSIIYVMNKALKTLNKSDQVSYDLH